MPLSNPTELDDATLTEGLTVYGDLVSETGNIELENPDAVISIGGTVVARAHPDWTTATGVANTGAFDTETATTLDIARRIKALEDALFGE